MSTGVTYTIPTAEPPNPMRDLAYTRMRLFNELYESCYQKYKRARKHEVQRQWWNKYEHFHKIYTRYSDMYFRLRKITNKTLQEIDLEIEHNRYNARIKDKETRRRNFLLKHRYSMWFMGNHFGADYGRFTCGKCENEFFHSPSTITKAGKEVYNCCCGYCTNWIIQIDWNETPYEK